MNVSIYWTVWLSLFLFTAGELGRARMGIRASARAWPWWVWAAGIAFMAVHFALAFEVRHGWSHAAALRATAAQTAAVYGFDWGGGVFVNYLFLGVWAIDAGAWRAAPDRYASRGPLWSWTLRAFYLVIILNAAVVFAAGPRRLLGAVIVATLVWSWRHGPFRRPSTRRSSV